MSLSKLINNRQLNYLNNYIAKMQAWAFYINTRIRELNKAINNRSNNSKS